MRNIIILLVCLSPFIKSFAQQPYFDHFTIESGLANNQIFNIIQDDHGYMWFGTLNGLNRYNGSEFDTYMPLGKTEGYLKGNIVLDLNKGRGGNIWVVTQNGGLNFYNARYERFYQFADSLFPFPQNIIHNIIEDSEGNIRFIAHNNLYKLNLSEEKVSALTTQQNIRQQFVFSNDIHCLINAESIELYDTHSEEKMDAGILLTSLNEVKYLTRTPLFDIQILTSDGIFQYSQESMQLSPLITFKELPAYFPNKNNLQKLVSDGNNFWIKYGSEVFKLNKDTKDIKIEFIDNNPFNINAFHGITVSDIYVDSDKNTWIGTNKNGINIYNKRKNQFNHYYPYGYSSENNTLNPVRAICETKDGNIWVGFENSGLGYYKPGDKNFYPLDTKNVNIGSPRAIFEDSKNNLWIGTRIGLYVLANRSNKLQSVNDYMKIQWNSSIYTIQEDEKGIIWIGGQKLGILDLENGSIKTIETPELKSPVRHLQFDGDHIWIATDANGVLQYKHASMELIRHFSLDDVAHTISDNKVYTLCIQQNNVWAGTNSGLSKINKITEAVQNYYTQDGLSSNVIYGIFTDYKQNLWISTAKGLNFFDTNKHTFIQYLSNRFFLDDAFSNNGTNKFYFGGFNGFISFKPEQIIPATTGQKPQLKEMFLLGQKVEIGEKSVLEKSLSHTQKIVLKHSQNTFAFTTNSFPISSSGLSSFKYKLEGYDKNWVTIHHGNRIEFSQVPPGDYTLQVLTSNADGYWSTNGMNLQINIIPPFWKTTWFTALLIVFVGLLLFALIKARERNIKQRNVILEREVELKTSTLRQQNHEISIQKDEIQKMSEQVHHADMAKLRFFTDVSHEFKTPLTLIIGHIEMIMQTNNSNLSASFITIKRNALKLLNLVNDIVDFRKASQGELSLSVSHVNLTKTLMDIVNDFKSAAKLKKIQLSYEPHNDELWLWVDENKFEKIINNLISNALKYTPEHGLIQVFLTASDNSVTLHIKDNGIGIDAIDKDKIFDRFYRSSNHHEVGHGIGLALAKSLTELHQGKIRVESTPGQGSCFSVELLKGTQHLPKNCFVTPQLLEKTNRDKMEFSYSSQTASLNLIKAGAPSLLIVEDNSDLMDFICSLLRTSYSITTASNGLEALKKLDIDQPDLVISDIMMPEMDGISFCKKVKNDIRFSHIPFILLTAKSDVETRIQGFQLGIDDYIEKPFNPELLLARIASLLKNRELLKKEFQKGMLTLNDDTLMLSGDKVFIEKLVSFMNSNYHKQELSVDDFGKEIGMSRATFFRKFKGLTGQAPSDFIKGFRIQKASAFIRAGKHPVSDICTMVGYRSPSQFRLAFKEEFNMSPLEYLKMHVRSR